MFGREIVLFVPGRVVGRADASGAGAHLRHDMDDYGNSNTSAAEPVLVFTVKTGRHEQEER